MQNLYSASKNAVVASAFCTTDCLSCMQSYFPFMSACRSPHAKELDTNALFSLQCALVSVQNT